MTTALINGRVLTPHGFVTGHAVLIEGGSVSALLPRVELDPAIETTDLNGAMLLPGFLDTQVNGGGGVLFNAAPTVETIRQIGAAHRRYGTTGFLPTLISDHLDTIAAAIAAVDAAILEGVQGVLGIHIEGPFLCEERKGIHDATRFRTLELAQLDLLASLKHGVTLLTLAPESVTPELIAALTARGVIVVLGHTNATAAQASTAFDAGATGVTHLFNAMSPLTSREPGVVGAALDDDRIYCPIIVDGRHAAPTTLRVALRCKPANRMMLVTDAMPPVGSDDLDFDLFGRLITVRDEVCVAEDGTLAGSHLNMVTALDNAMRLLGASLPEASAMASANPAAFLGLSGTLGQIAPGQCASLVALDDALRVTATWIDGQYNQEGAR